MANLKEKCGVFIYIYKYDRFSGKFNRNLPQELPFIAI